MITLMVVTKPMNAPTYHKIKKYWTEH